LMEKLVEAGVAAAAIVGRICSEGEGEIHVR